MSLWIAVLTFSYLGGGFETRKISTWKGCDMSVCNTLDLNWNGSFQLRSFSQVSTETICGSYRISGDTLYLFRDSSIMGIPEIPRDFRRKRPGIRSNFERWRLYGL